LADGEGRAQADNRGMRPYTFTAHAERQAAARSVDVREVAAIVAERVTDPGRASWAVVVGHMPAGGWQGGSNGDVVWAIVRDGAIRTVMFRRADQPATPAALRVDKVIA
jgi:hypothetical protein